MAIVTPVSDRLKNVNPSITQALGMKATAMIKNGQDVIKLDVGEPDFHTPQFVKDAGIRAIQENFTKYTDVGGLPDFKEAVCRKLERENGLIYKPSQIIGGTGAKEIIAFCFQASLNEDNEVIIPAPYWVSYPEMVKLHGAKPVPVQTRPERGFKLQPEDLENAITPRTRWLVLNSPNNPTGAVYTAEDLRALAKVLAKHEQVWILSDDVYEHFVYDDARFSTIVQVAAELADRTIIVNSLSKSFNMTGWRMGFGAGPEELIGNMKKLESQSSTNPCAISQMAAIAAFEGPQGFRTAQIDAFRERRNIAFEELNKAGLTCAEKPDGAFYLYPSCAKLIGAKAKERTLETDADVATYFLEEALVSTVPGVGFGLSPYFRISYALDTDRLKEACRRIARAVGEIDCRLG